MRKNVFGRQLKRDKNERKALFKGLMSALVLKEKIKTTEEKAKAIRGQAEKLVTKAKKKGQGASPLLSPYLSPLAMNKMITELGSRFKDRPGGYTRIIKLGRRFGDNAMTVLMEWTEPSEIKKQISQPKAGPPLAENIKNVETITEEEVKPKRKTNVKTKTTAITKPKTKTKKARKEVKK
ncbi:MAG: 50S ribosomal protein L17 [Candidatus Levybacteria bacterium]|nr:50S ribosomal protein L17 [Candidatus Levybacteria bacterium]